jgi:galactonate dehydratase
MKITDIRTFLMHAGQPDPAQWAADGHSGNTTERSKLTGFRNWLFVKVYTDAGIVGIGECSGWPLVIETAVQDLKSLLIGEDPTHIERLWQKMQIAMMGHGLLGTVGAGAMTGIDIALWDIKGKALGVPVWNLLGGKVRDRISIYSHANTPEMALSVKKRGIKAIKCGGVADPVRKVAMLREAMGDEVDIAIDLHGPPWLTPADAARVARALEPYNLLWIEDPIAPDNIEGYKRIREAAHVPLAAGERTATIFGERELIERELVDIIQPDTGRAGGITQMKKIAVLGEAYQVPIAPHCTASLLGIAASLHVACSVPLFLIHEFYPDNMGFNPKGMVRMPYAVDKDGYVTLPPGPGLGVEIDEKAIAQAAKKPQTYKWPGAKLKDGSIADY